MYTILGFEQGIFVKIRCSFGKISPKSFVFRNMFVICIQMQDLTLNNNILMVMKKILILCTGNSCRSQMAMGYLRSFDSSLDVHSAGTKPTNSVNPFAIKVMKEEGIDFSNETPKSVELYLNQKWDFVITVCDGANASCPEFCGKVGKRLHIGFDDPASAVGTEEEILGEFRRIRDEIKDGMQKFYLSEVKAKGK